MFAKRTKSKHMKHTWATHLPQTQKTPDTFMFGSSSPESPTQSPCALDRDQQFIDCTLSQHGIVLLNEKLRLSKLRLDEAAQEKGCEPGCGPISHLFDSPKEAHFAYQRWLGSRPVTQPFVLPTQDVPATESSDIRVKIVAQTPCKKRSKQRLRLVEHKTASSRNARQPNSALKPKAPNHKLGLAQRGKNEKHKLFPLQDLPAPPLSKISTPPPARTSVLLYHISPQMLQGPNHKFWVDIIPVPPHYNMLSISFILKSDASDPQQLKIKEHEFQVDRDGRVTVSNLDFVCGLHKSANVYLEAIVHCPQKFNWDFTQRESPRFSLRCYKMRILGKDDRRLGPDHALVQMQNMGEKLATAMDENWELNTKWASWPRKLPRPQPPRTVRELSQWPEQYLECLAGLMSRSRSPFTVEKMLETWSSAVSIVRRHNIQEGMTPSRVEGEEIFRTST